MIYLLEQISPSTELSLCLPLQISSSKCRGETYVVFVSQMKKIPVSEVLAKIKARKPIRKMETQELSKIIRSPFPEILVAYIFRSRTWKMNYHCVVLTPSVQIFPPTFLQPFMPTIHIVLSCPQSEHV